MPNSVKQVRSANRSLVLNSIVQNGQQTIEDIMRTTGLSRPTVVGILNGLIGDELIVKSGFASVEVGRQPALFSMNTASHFTVGIDLDFPPVHISIADLAGNPVYYDNWDMPAEAEMLQVSNTIASHVQQAFNNLRLNPERCLGVGIGVPTIRNDTRRGKKISVARIKGWDSLDIGEHLSQQLGLEVFVRNDAQLIGMRENNLRNNPNDSFLFVLWRWGVGMAIFMQGNLYEGTFGNGGQISHQVINAFSQEQCYCGSYGCLELYASRKAIVKAFKDRYREAHGQDAGDMPVEAIFALGDEGDPLAAEVLERAGMALGTALSSAAKMLDIPDIVISGLNCCEQNPFWRSMEQVLLNNTAHSLVEPPRVTKSRIVPEHYGMGGCHFVLKNYFDVPNLQLSVV